MALIGLMITRDDEAVFETWCEDQLPLYDVVVCLDGSTTEATAGIADRYSEKLFYLHERNCTIPHKTDHGLRRVVHEEIVKRFGHGHWIMCCHADEFCYHDPRKIAALAEAGGYDLVSWYSPHFYPHPSELVDWDQRRLLPVPERHRFYHWGHVGTGLPWIEDRLYHDRDSVHWDEVSHGSVRAHGLTREAPFHPIFRHFKVIATDTNWCEVMGGSTYFKHHWVGLEHRTGVPFPVATFEDLFVDSVPKYTVCSQFEGTFEQSWNMGEEFRPDRDRRGARSRPSEATAPKGAIVEPPADSPVSLEPSRHHQRNVPVVTHRFRIALGPENPAFGSWNWLGPDLARELAGHYDVRVFRDAVPDADVTIFFKFLPDVETMHRVRARSAIVFCPVDVYGSAAEIDGDVKRLRTCNHVVVHCRRLTPYFQSYAPTSYLDHHVKYVIPTREEAVTDGPILWVGEQSNLPPLVDWVNAHDLALPLVVLTNAPTQEAAALGFLRRNRVSIEPWSPEQHREWLKRARVALDIKGDDFRARHKSPAKALDFLASGLPLAINRPTSGVDHLRDLGFDVADAKDEARWLSAEYAAECRQFGHAISETLSLTHVGQRWREVLGEALNARNKNRR